MNPFPGHRDLYVLAAGLVLGIVLGPSVLGRLAPQAYASLFGTAGVRAQLDQARTDSDAKLRELATQGATDEQIGQLTVQRDQQLQMLESAVTGQMNARAVQLMLGLLVAMAVTFVAEAAWSPVPRRNRDRNPRPDDGEQMVLSPWTSRLTTVRYALLAGVLAVLLARPPLFEQTPWLFTALIVAVAFGAAALPLSKRQTKELRTK
jgi:hypothetical protein